MPTIESLRDEDAALHEMYRDDKDTLSAEDEAAYQELIEAQRSSYQDTVYERLDKNGNVSPAIAPSIGDAALHNGLGPEVAEYAQHVSAAENWRQTK